jgi:hypothetical protein
VQVLTAVNDQCDVHGAFDVDVAALPDLLRDLGLPDAELLTALADLHELGLIEGIAVAECRHPIRVTRVTARGRQELP